VSRLADVLDRLVAEGEGMLHQGRFAEAEQRARQVLSQQPRTPSAHALLGMSSLVQERHAEALAHVEAALKVDRVNARYHFLAALCLAGLARVEEAIAAYRRALQFQPGFLEARANLGFLLECSKRPADAAECYRRVLEADPRNFYCLNRLAYCERLMGRADLAVELLQRALRLDPQFAASHNELALALLEAGRPGEALGALRAAVAADPGFAQGWANLAKLLYVEHLEAVQSAERQGLAVPDASAVVECFDRLLAFEPANVEFRYLRDSLAGVRIERPPDRYIETFFDRFAPQFEARLVGELGYSAPGAARQLLEPLLEGRAGLRAVDLGCGTGLAGPVLRPFAARLAGVDLSSAMLELARARGVYDELAKEEIGDWLSRERGTVDVALALDVFIYVGDLARIMRAVSTALAPGGIFAFSIEDLPVEGGDFELRPAGRYAHARDYVVASAVREGLRLAAAEEFTIRREAGRPVPARMFAFGKD
jgi:predicted TPR repeat methyltransferase